MTFRFDYEFFEYLLESVLSARYKFRRFDEASLSSEKTFYLRHDVDISPISALELARIENRVKVRANFFFQMGAETYNIFSPASLQIIREIRSLDHCVGLHIDHHLEENESRIASTLEWFCKCVTPIDPVVSFHRPSRSVLGREYKRFINSYREAFFSPGRYLSDSRRNREFYPLLVQWLEEGRNPIQLLLHPEWWYPEEDTVRFKEILLRRRLAELEEYLSTNFNKVFGDLKEIENSIARL
jgi:hypothetical protein